jgi:hypothetical protein
MQTLDHDQLPHQSTPEGARPFPLGRRQLRVNRFQDDEGEQTCHIWAPQGAAAALTYVAFRRT